MAFECVHVWVSLLPLYTKDNLIGYKIICHGPSPTPPPGLQKWLSHLLARSAVLPFTMTSPFIFCLARFHHQVIFIRVLFSQDPFMLNAAMEKSKARLTSFFLFCKYFSPLVWMTEEFLKAISNGFYSQEFSLDFSLGCLSMSSVWFWPNDGYQKELSSFY